MCFFHLGITISSVSLTKSPSSVPIAGYTTIYTFGCSVSVQCTTPHCGMDTVNIKWFFNNVIITDTSPLVSINTGDTSVTSNDTVQSVLTTEGTISTSHAGIYRCRANLNSNTTVVVMSNTMTLNVKSKLLEFYTCNGINEFFTTFETIQYNRLIFFILTSTPQCYYISFC